MEVDIDSLDRRILVVVTVYIQCITSLQTKIPIKEEVYNTFLKTCRISIELRCRGECSRHSLEDIAVQLFSQLPDSEEKDRQIPI